MDKAHWLQIKESHSTDVEVGKVAALSDQSKKNREDVTTEPKPPTPNDGPYVVRVQQLTGQLKELEEVLELDELDHVARRHARPPGENAAEALEALALLSKNLPLHFENQEVNLNPDRLMQLADRDRALAALEPVLRRLLELVQDSRMEEGDELVELLNVGYRQAQPLNLEEDSAVDQARAVLKTYHEQAHLQGAHLSAADRNPQKPRKSKG